ncbi:MAG: cupin domain-containing protein [Acidimicrobiia bacterium]
MDVVHLPSQPDYPAPDGSEVRLLVQGDLGGLAHFLLPAGRQSDAKSHRSVEELWYCLKGRGELCVGDEVTTLCPGISVRIPPNRRFQFRSHGPGALEILGTTMPPWPGPQEADDAEPYWPPIGS